MDYISKMLTAIKIKKVQIRQRAEENRHHQIHEKAAWRSINQAIQVNGWKLTEENKRKADEYAVDVFGRKEYAPWLYFFTLFSGEFKEGWIPLNYYTKYILPDPSLSRISSVKTFSSRVLNTEYLPDLGYFINGKLYNREFSLISFDDLRKIVTNDCGKIFVKGDNSLRGLSIHKFEADEVLEGNFLNIGNCVIQRFIEQHEFFNEINQSSTSAFRISTVRNKEGKIEYRASYLKVGRKDEDLYRSDIGIWIAIKDVSGNLDDYCYAHGNKRLTAHPDSNASFANKKIPRFSDAVDLCLKLHKAIPHFPIIGWDLTVDKYEKIQLLEWNAGSPHPGIGFHQATLGPCFSGLGWEDLWK